MNLPLTLPLAPPSAMSAPSAEPARTSPQGAPGGLAQDLAQALQRGQLTLYFQPRVSLASRRILGAEALARWPHRQRGMVPPLVFIALAEQTGLINQLGGWALSTACSEATRWPGSTAVSVNVSAHQLMDGLLLRQVRSALEESGLPPERLEVELTESTVVDASIETLLTLSALRDLGVSLALDDFGTGYASLAALKRLPLTAMKLDRSLTRGVPRNREDSEIVRAVVATARALGLAIIVEGIESEPQCRFFAAAGCDEGQAYFFGRPAPAERFRRSLAADAPAPGPSWPGRPPWRAHTRP